MIDIKRLHEVHYQYPNILRRKGKTTYCFDSLLRASQTGAYERLYYIINDMRSAFDSIYDFKCFLNSEYIEYEHYDKNILSINGCTIIFSSSLPKQFSCSYGIIEDLH